MQANAVISRTISHLSHRSINIQEILQKIKFSSFVTNNQSRIMSQWGGTFARVNVKAS